MPSVENSSIQKITNIKGSYPLSKLRNYENHDSKFKI